MRQSDVLIIGAGPTGLVLALWLAKLSALTTDRDYSARSSGVIALLGVVRSVIC
jgi:flavin-dependent dehydrogenase